METFRCGALAEMVVPKDKVSSKRQEEITTVCNCIDELMYKSIHGRKMRVAAKKEGFCASFIFGNFDTSQAEKPWDLVLRNASKVVIKPVDDSNLKMSIDIPYGDVVNSGEIEERYLATNRRVRFQLLIEELAGRGIDPSMVNTKRLNEIAEECAAMEVCTQVSYIQVQLDERFVTMIDMELSGEFFRITDPPAFVRVHDSSWGFDFYPALGGVVVAETTFNGYLDPNEVYR